MLDFRQTLSDIRQTLSDIRRSLSDIRQTLSDFQQTLSDIRRILSDIRQTLSDIRQTLSDIRQTLSDFQQTLSDIRRSLSDIRQTLSDIHQTLSKLPLQAWNVVETFSGIVLLCYRRIIGGKRLHGGVKKVFCGLMITRATGANVASVPNAGNKKPSEPEQFRWFLFLVLGEKTHSFIAIRLRYLF